MTLSDFKVVTLNDIIGYELQKSCFESILKNKSESPNFFILAGPDGTGRKSLIKNFISSIYCELPDKKYFNCGKCESCLSVLDNNTIYKEIDFSEINNMTYSKYIVIKDFELCPRDLQVKLIEWWNDKEEKPTIFIVTKDTNNIIEDLRSISLILRTNPIPENEIIKKLMFYKEKFNLQINDKYITLIAKRARGSLTSAYKLFLNYLSLDEDTATEMTNSAREYFIAFLISCYSNNLESVNKFINKLMTIPLAYLKIDYESLILEILKVFTKTQEPSDDLIKTLIIKSKSKILDLYYILNDKVIYNSFQNEDSFQSALYVIYLKLTNKL